MTTPPDAVLGRTLPRPSTLARGIPAPSGFGDASLTAAGPGAITLLGGIPDVSALPIDAIADATDRALRHSPRASDAFQYSSSFGLDPLRAWIAEREGVDPARVVITNGGMHGLHLSVLATLDPGDLIAVDNPVYPLFLRVLDLVGAEHLPIPVDEHGLDIDALEHEIEAGRVPRAVYTVSDFGNPAQATLSAARRTRLVALAERHGIALIIDNPYRELRFRGEHVSSDVFNASPNVLHVNTFSKTLGPGLRLGWVVAPEELAPHLVQLRNREDSHTSTLAQEIVISLLTDDPGWFDHALAPSLALYRRRADALEQALHAQLPGQFETAAPDGGFFLWPRLVNDAVDADAVAERARAHGVVYQQGRHFASGPGTDSGRRLRFAYGNRDEATLDEAVRRLALAFADVVA